MRGHLILVLLSYKSHCSVSLTSVKEEYQDYDKIQLVKISLNLDLWLAITIVLKLGYFSTFSCSGLPYGA